MATYVIGDIHNSLQKLEQMLELISPSMRDHVIFMGDLFDRGGAKPDPVGVYFKILGLSAKVTWIRGNHDQLLAEYIFRYFETPEKKRKGLPPYLQEFDSIDHFKVELIEYLDYYNNRRIKAKLKGLTTAQHRRQTLQAA